MEQTTTAQSTTRTRVWSELILEDRVEFGSAAHNNRARYTGQKIHRLATAYVVGIVEDARPRTGTFGANFIRTGKPQLFSAHPVCGVTNGQHAGQPFADLTLADVTCSKCSKYGEPR